MKKLLIVFGVILPCGAQIHRAESAQLLACDDHQRCRHEVHLLGNAGGGEDFCAGELFRRKCHGTAGPSGAWDGAGISRSEAALFCSAEELGVAGDARKKNGTVISRNL